MMQSIHLKDVTYTIQQQPIIHELSLNIHAGDWVDITGTKGAGKTTLLHLMIGGLQPDQGTVELLGQPTSPKQPSILRQIGYVPEQADIRATLSALEYLAVVAGMYGIEEKPARHQALTWLTEMNLEEVMMQPLARLNDTQQLKVMIAASLIHNPNVILWDNVFARLDQSTSKWLVVLLQQLIQQEKTVITTSEQPLIGCTRLITFEHGMIIQEDHQNDEQINQSSANIRAKVQRMIEIMQPI
ncbi:ATP-binding cassette domain-containing protein [Atopobacter phocae]|uniref:ATP-binding cassette domain-containing protein n=1 Tax=Atopobacter phocae TaxID=136492 RepID=UPI0004B568BC|nr:ABC transporter ATP-binding protein [Atopobacter phocae]